MRLAIHEPQRAPLVAIDARADLDEWETKNRDERWLLEWSGFSMPGIAKTEQRRFRTMGDGRAFIAKQGWS